VVRKRGPDRPRLLRSRLGGCLLVVALVAVVGPVPASAAPPRPLALKGMTIGEHLKALAAHGKNYLQRMRPEVVQRLSAGGQTLIKLGDKAGDIDQLVAGA
jgi:hypothetical protein